MSALLILLVVGSDASYDVRLIGLSSNDQDFLLRLEQRSTSWDEERTESLKICSFSSKTLKAVECKTIVENGLLEADENRASDFSKNDRARVWNSVRLYFVKQGYHIVSHPVELEKRKSGKDAQWCLPSELCYTIQRTKRDSEGVYLGLFRGRLLVGPSDLFAVRSVASKDDLIERITAIGPDLLLVAHPYHLEMGYTIVADRGD